MNRITLSLLRWYGHFLAFLLLIGLLLLCPKMNIQWLVAGIYVAMICFTVSAYIVYHRIVRSIKKSFNTAEKTIVLLEDIWKCRYIGFLQKKMLLHHAMQLFPESNLRFQALMFKSPATKPLRSTTIKRLSPPHSAVAS